MTREQNRSPDLTDTGASDTGASEEPSLETRLRRLDEIVAQLEGGEAELEAGLALFEEGVRHIREAEALLARAELRVEELVGGEGDTRTRRFEGEGIGDA
ncbi:MAG: exodeoxyribonuclease VII small subunit [Gemmatimonadales bacterium]|nr:MAG: exodeoxyribonuclease VII small subunit [Gemmatimonadales bacterium]